MRQTFQLDPQLSVLKSHPLIANPAKSRTLVTRSEPTPGGVVANRCRLLGPRFWGIGAEGGRVREIMNVWRVGGFFRSHVTYDCLFS